MTKINEFHAKQKGFNDRMDAAVEGVRADIEALNKTIKDMQNSPGEISAEDQAFLDSLEARGEAIAAKLEALDAAHPVKDTVEPPFSSTPDA